MNEGAQGPLWQAGDIIDGRYQVIRLAGRGGMGWVYQVKHLEWGIDLAMKQLRPDVVVNSKARKQFVEEAEAWVKVGLHPNVCCCHYVRQFDKLPMVFAEYVPGGSLGNWITDRRLYEGSATDVLHRILDVAVQFAWGLEHAHRRGFVHQDVKPGNVLLDMSSGDMSVKVTDFGLARAQAGNPLPPLAPATDASGAASSILVSRAGLTPAYASPEQAVGAVLSRRTDVYSYAVSVLEMFTGKCLWRTGSAAAQALNTFRFGGIVGSEMPAMPDNVGALLECCLRRDPSQRPSSMVEVAAEVLSIYQSELHHGYPRTMPDAAGLRADELNNRAISLLDLGRTAEAEATFTAAQEADPRHLAAAYNVGLLRWRRGSITDEDLLAQIPGDERSDSVLAQCLRAHVHLERCDVDATQSVLDGIDEDTATNQPEVRAVQRALDEGRGGDMFIRSVSAGQKPDRSDDRLVRFSRDGVYMVTGHKHGLVRLWDAQTGENLRTLTVDSGAGEVEHVDVNANGQIGVVNVGSTVQIWDFTTGKLMHEFFVSSSNVQDEGEDRGVLEVRLSPDGRWAFAATAGIRLKAGRIRGAEILGWDLRTGQCSQWQRLDGYDARASFEVGGADGSHLLAVSSNRGKSVSGVYRHQLVYLTQRERRVLAELDKPFETVAFTANGRFAVVANTDHRIRVWDLHSSQCIQEVPSTPKILRLAVSDGARWALSSGYGPTRLWDLAAGRCLRTFNRRDTTAIWLSPDAHTGRSAGGWDPSARLTHVDPFKRVESWSFQRPSNYHAPPQLSRPCHVPELNRLSDEAQALVREAERAIADRRYGDAHLALTQMRALSGHERTPETLQLWRELGGHLPRIGLRGAWTTSLLRAEVSTNELTTACIAADGSVAVTAHRSSAYLWDMNSGDMVRTYPLGTSVDAVGLSENGQQIVAAGQLGTSEAGVYMWSAQTENGGILFWPLDMGQGRRARTAVMTPDGKRLLWGNGNELQVLEVDTSRRKLRRLEPLPDHPQKTKAWISIDGRIAVSATEDSIRLWDLDYGECLVKIPLPASTLARSIKCPAVCASPDGKHIVAAGGVFGHQLRMWNSAGEPVREFDCPTTPNVVQFSPDGRFIFADGHGKTVMVWDAEHKAPAYTINGAERRLENIRFTPDGRYMLVTGHHSISAQVWELDWDLTPVAVIMSDIGTKGIRQHAFKIRTAVTDPFASPPPDRVRREFDKGYLDAVQIPAESVDLRARCLAEAVANLQDSETDRSRWSTAETLAESEAIADAARQLRDEYRYYFS